MLQTIYRKTDLTAYELRWIKDWPANSRQRILINGKTLNYIHVISGVFKGYVLGSILYTSIIYVNNLELNLLIKISKFADHIKLRNKVQHNISNLNFT